MLAGTLGRFTGLSLLLATGALALATGCDTKCVGPECTPVDGDTDDTEVVDTDTSPGDERIDVLPLVRDCDVVRFHKPPAGARTVQIAGAFNDWTPADLDGPDDQGWWQVNLGPLEPGLYPYKYLYGGVWESEIPTSSELQWDGGIENRSLRVGDCTKPELRVVSATATPEGSVDVSVRYALGEQGRLLAPAEVIATVGGVPVTPTLDTDTQTIRVQASGLPSGKHTVRVTAADQAGVAAENETFTPLWVEDTPFAWTDGPMYLIFVDRFRDGDGVSSPMGGTGALADYMGGDLLGVLHAIEEGWFDELGIRSIWLSPLNDNAEGTWLGTGGATYAGYHGYWPIKARAVESRFGDSGKSAAARLKDVVQAAHDRGIRVVMDAVYNHVHSDHEYLVDHPEWAGNGCICGSDGCSWDFDVLECRFTSYMPDLDHANPWITEQLLVDTMWWMREFDLDGLRIDAVKHMRRNMTVNLRHRIRSEIEQGGGAKVYTVGETFTGSGGHGELLARIGPHEMDAQFDFPIYWTIRDVFAHGASMQALENTVRTGIDTWGDAPMSPFAGNHDIPRLATEIAGNTVDGWGATPDLLAGFGDQTDLIGRVRNALVFALTQPGVPLLYYGDEIGLAGAGDPDNRRRMTFPPNLSSHQQAVLDSVRRAGTARTELVSLQRGSWTPLWAEQDMTAFARHTDGETTVVVVHRGAARTTDIPLQGLVADGTVLRDRMQDGRSVTVSEGKLRVALSGHDVAILAP